MNDDIAKDLKMRMDKASFLLGIAWGFMRGNKETYSIHGLIEPESFKEGYAIFCKGMEELFYNETN